MRRLTFSSLALAEACPASHVLPGIEQDTAEAAVGTETHQQIADWLAGTGDLLPYRPQARAAIQWLLDSGLAANAEAEVPYALNWQTGEVRRLLVQDREYPDLGPDWIYGTVDLAGRHGARCAHREAQEQQAHDCIEDLHPSQPLVLDWKTGYPAGSLGPPSQALQLLAAAYCVRYCASNEGPVSLAYAYLPESGAVVQQEEVSDWAAVLARIRRIAERVEHEESTLAIVGRDHLRPRTGEHCRYCPAKLACPASAQAVALLTPADGITAAEGERLAAAYNAAVHLRRVLPLVEERAKLLAREGLLPGWRLAQRERREIDATVAHQQVAEVYGPDIADAACPRECSQSSLRAALREVAAARQLGAEMDEMLDRIDQAGGVRRTSYEVLERE